MSLISIKKYLDLASSGDYRPTLDLLAETVTQDPIALSPAQCEQFRSEVAAILEHLAVPIERDQFTIAVGAISQAVRGHNQSVSTLIGNQSVELQNMVIMLTQAIRSLGSASDASVRNLEEIALQLKRTSALEDVSQLRMRLSECLGKLRDETARHKDYSQRSLQALNVKLAESQHHLAQHGIAADVDGVTGFAGRSTAEKLIHEALASKESCYVLVAVLRGMQAVNSLFGYDVGDEMLYEFAAGLAANFPRHDMTCRWSGPAFVVLLHRSGPLQVVRIDAGHAIASAPTSKIISNQGRNALASFTTATLVVPVTAPAANIFSEIDGFVATRVHE
ncbi:MAG TPA: GGDEF domain-containing protein [Bryocella sp.]|nr:GGDEF domain-containing protein [Bryocella sp.]